MYGYSWLKPAGCNKTMLGRREEELEREKVERQMRDAELQERMAAEADEMERQAERDAEGDAAGMDDRDLDDEVPDADIEADVDEEGWGDEESVVGEDDGMRDLDDDIPSAPDADPGDVFSDDSNPQQAQSSPQRDAWAYDTRRDPSTPSSPGQPPYANANTDTETDAALRRVRAQARMQRQAGYQRRPGAPGSDYDIDERDAEAMALADEMLDEDEMGETSFASQRRVQRQSEERNLDDSIPEAADDAGSGEWEHTDSDEEMSSEASHSHELHHGSFGRHPATTQAEADALSEALEASEEDEDQEMDISYMSTQQAQPHRHPQPTQIQPRNVSLNATPQIATSTTRSRNNSTNTPRPTITAGRVVSGNASAHLPPHQRRREGSGVSSSVASSGRRSTLDSNRGSRGSRRGLRSQAHVQPQLSGSQNLSFETPTFPPPQSQLIGIPGADPNTSALLGTDSSFGMGMGMSTAGSMDIPDSMQARPRRGQGISGAVGYTAYTGTTQQPTQVNNPSRRPAWLNPTATTAGGAAAGARRNLFAGLRNNAAGSAEGAGGSSGGLFTPEAPRGGATNTAFETPEEGDDGGDGGTGPGGRQTRSGRLLANFARRTGRG